MNILNTAVTFSGVKTTQIIPTLQSFQEGRKRMEKKKAAKAPIPVKDLTICDATAQMIEKARRDGVETAFDRAANMKACPIGDKSACCKHCFMGPCRLNAADPYAKVGVCGADIDTIQARN